jgi:SAM-dependent methyltransferase
METPIEQHQAEILRNKKAWETKPALRAVYKSFYERIRRQIDPNIRAPILEIGSGMGQLKDLFPGAICTDLFPNSWLDLVCDGYELPFQSASIGHIILFDVFHHLERPVAFFKEARRALAQNGKLILFEPYVSLASWPVYGLLHHEPVGWGNSIDGSHQKPANRAYYAAQGNATRMFFSSAAPIQVNGWKIASKEAFSSFAYLLGGGFSKPGFYPRATLPLIERMDRLFTMVPRLFGARCLVVMQPEF